MSRLALAVLLACSIATPVRASDDPTTLDYAIGSDVDSLDPHWAYDAVSLFVDDQVYETLIDFAGESSQTPVLRAPSFPYFEQTVALLGGDLKGLLGLSVLGDRRLIFDGPHKTIRLQPR